MNRDFYKYFTAVSNSENHEYKIPLSLNDSGELVPDLEKFSVSLHPQYPTCGLSKTNKIGKYSERGF